MCIDGNCFFNECYNANNTCWIIHDECFTTRTIHDAWYMMNVRTHMIHDEWYNTNDTWCMNMMNCYSMHDTWWMLEHTWYMMNDTWCMIQHQWYMMHDTRWIVTAHMIHDELYVMNATIHAMNYVECYHGYQHHYHCLLTHNNPMFWLLSPLAHTATQVITKQRGRACFCRLMPPHMVR